MGSRSTFTASHCTVTASGLLAIRDRRVSLTTWIVESIDASMYVVNEDHFVNSSCSNSGLITVWEQFNIAAPSLLGSVLVAAGTRSTAKL